jgi:hypothetical protein
MEKNLQEDFESFLNLLKQLRTDSLNCLPSLVSLSAACVDLQFITQLQQQPDSFGSLFASESKFIEMVVLSHQTDFHEQVLMLQQPCVCYCLYLISKICRSFDREFELLAKFLEFAPESNILYYKQLSDSLRLVFGAAEKSRFEDLITLLHQSITNQAPLSPHHQAELLQLFLGAEHIFPLFNSILQLFTLAESLELFSTLRLYTPLELLLFFGLKQTKRYYLQDYFILFCNLPTPFQSSLSLNQNPISQSPSFASVYPQSFLYSPQQFYQSPAPFYPQMPPSFSHAQLYPQSGFSNAQPPPNSNTPGTCEFLFVFCLFVCLFRFAKVLAKQKDKPSHQVYDTHLDFNPDENLTSAAGEELKLAISRQPPEVVVSNRNISPHPIIEIHGNLTYAINNNANLQYFIQPILISCETNEELVGLISYNVNTSTGSKKDSDSENNNCLITVGLVKTIVVRNLKILKSSKQSMFCIKFRLIAIDGNDLSMKKKAKCIDEVMSHPITVYSNVCQIKNRPSKAQAPVVTEIIPFFGSCNGMFFFASHPLLTHRKYNYPYLGRPLY